MKAYIKERTLQVASYVLDTNNTIRKTAQVFRISKSTVHNDLSKRLQQLDRTKYDKVQKILEENFSEKHIRGGDATKQKYAAAKEREL